MPTQVNHTIVVNHPTDGFGCRKRCTYCTWGSSKWLPHGLQSLEAILAFSKECGRSFVTFSGGGDPLYMFDRHGNKLFEAMDTVRDAAKKRIRIITREVPSIKYLKGHVDYVSVSLDHAVEARLHSERRDLTGMYIECSLVLPMLDTESIVKLMPKYQEIQRRLRYPLVLRENLNSTRDLDIREVCSYLPPSVKLVAKKLCLEGKYLLQDGSRTGHEFTFSMKPLLDLLFEDPTIYVYGGFLKHLVNPAYNHDYSDIDIVTVGSSARIGLEEFGYVAKTVGQQHRSPIYWQMRSDTGGPPIHIVQFESHISAVAHLQSAQFQLDRAYIKGGDRCSDTFAFIDIEERVARRCKVDHTARTEMVERNHENKLRKKGFKIV